MKSRNWIFILYIVIGVAARFANLHDALYFTYDQGRDAYAIQRITQGDFTLIGPTTGLEGFFTGPLWYYAGVPGFVLGGGNPSVLSAWYVFLAALALPLYWIIAHRLFASDKKLAVLTAYLLALVPGNITASLQIWNPLLLLPMVPLCLWLFFDSKRSAVKMVGAFFILGLGLHAEFASVMFLLAPLYLAIFWLRGRFVGRDYLLAGMAIALTLLPQLLFDIRNDWLLTRSLVRGVLANQDSAQPWLQHVPYRLGQLWDATAAILVGRSVAANAAMFVCAALLVFGLWWLTRTAKVRHETNWQLVAFLAIVPYPLYVFWRGNNGYFWDHYLTSQFLFLVPLIVKAAQVLSMRWRSLQTPLVVAAAIWLMLCAHHIWHRSIAPTNEAGLSVLNEAAARIYSHPRGGGSSPVVLIYTPNVYTDQYRYVLEWQARQRGVAPPKYSRTDGTDWFVLIEPDYQVPQRLQPWYYEATKSGELVSRQSVGHLTLETWRTAP